ncbi:MAG: penicillin-binding protein 2 [Bradymonadaceae bacterium]
MFENDGPQNRRDIGRWWRDAGWYRWFAGAALLVFGLLVVRLWYLQILRGEAYRRTSEENVVRNVEIEARRGRILSRDGAVMAGNRRTWDVVAVTPIVQRHSIAEIVDRLQRHLELSEGRAGRLQRRIRRRDGTVVVEHEVTRQELASIETDRLNLPGIEIRARQRRRYPFGRAAAHLVGYMGEIGPDELTDWRRYGYDRGDFVGRAGLETTFEPVLRGSDGVRRRVVDARGIPRQPKRDGISLPDYRRVPPVPGLDLRTTIDARLQLAVRRAMKDHPSGAVVAVDPRTGDVLALHSKPSFDPRAWSGRLSPREQRQIQSSPFDPMLDKAIRAYFPGSIFKIAGAFAGLNTDRIDPDRKVDCPGYYAFGDRQFRCWKWGGHGRLDMVGAIEQSCDVYFYRLADRLGIEPIAAHARRLGFGRATGIPLADEAAGTLPTRAWHRKHTPGGYKPGFALNVVLGQGNVRTTPLQAALAYAAIANGGRLYAPRLVKSIRTRSGREVFEFEPRVRRRLDIAEEDLRVIRRGLRRVVTSDDGTAHGASPESVSMAGKTGTAQVHSMGRVPVANRSKDLQLRDHAWFAAYAPVESPRLVVAVFLQHAGHGGQRAAPVARKIVEEYFDGDREPSLKRRIGRENTAVEVP